MPTTFKPTINVPFHMTLKYVDVWPNDPSKDPKGKGYGASLALRGDIDGKDVRVYPKGFLDANLAAMANAGIIETPQSGDFDNDPAEKYSIPVKHADIVVTLSQPAGERYAKTTFSKDGATGPQTESAPQRSRPRNIGTLPGDEPPHPAESYSQTRSAPATKNDTSKITQVERQYEATLTWVLDSVVPRLSKADIPVDAAAINSIIATCMIQASK